MRRVPVITFGLAFLAGSAAHAQSMAEAGAVIAGSTVGGAAGKSVSNGVTAIFDKVNKNTGAAAGKDAKKAPKSTAAEVPGRALIEAGPGQPQEVLPAAGTKTALATKPARKTKAADTAAAAPVPRWDDVPPPPALPNRAPVAAAKPAPAPVAVAIAPVRPAPLPPPPAVVVPPVTLEDLEKVTPGMTRAELLRIGQPAARITMFEDGGLLEIFSYHAKDPQMGVRTLGTVRLNDGTVSDVQLRR